MFSRVVQISKGYVRVPTAMADIRYDGHWYDCQYTSASVSRKFLTLKSISNIFTLPISTATTLPFTK